MPRASKGILRGDEIEYMGSEESPAFAVATRPCTGRWRAGWKAAGDLPLLLVEPVRLEEMLWSQWTCGLLCLLHLACTLDDVANEDLAQSRRQCDDLLCCVLVGQVIYELTFAVVRREHLIRQPDKQAHLFDMPLVQKGPSIDRVAILLRLVHCAHEGAHGDGPGLLDGLLPLPVVLLQRLFPAIFIVILVVVFLVFSLLVALLRLSLGVLLIVDWTALGAGWRNRQATTSARCTTSPAICTHATPALALCTLCRCMPLGRSAAILRPCIHIGRHGRTSRLPYTSVLMRFCLCCLCAAWFATSSSSGGGGAGGGGSGGVVLSLFASASRGIFWLLWLSCL